MSRNFKAFIAVIVCAAVMSQGVQAFAFGGAFLFGLAENYRLQKKAENGDSESQFKLGNMYR
ncbi:MAG: hypothetical protein IJG36_10270, partial [Synergistaceae bacterium]|nr:hypothetical protein [Synergistaceae bacterium]